MGSQRGKEVGGGEGPLPLASPSLSFLIDAQRLDSLVLKLR